MMAYVNTGAASLIKIRSWFN